MQHKNQEPVNSVATLSHLPRDVVFIVFNYLDNKSIRAVGSSSKTLHRYAIEWIPRSNLYYVVSAQLPLYTGELFWIPGGEVESCFKPNTNINFSTVNVFDKSTYVQLFDNFRDANQCREFMVTRRYNHHRETLDVVTRSGMMAVILKNNHLFALRKQSLTVREHIPDCPLPPEARELKLTCFATQFSNLHFIPFALFSERILPNSKEAANEFEQMWDKALQLSQHRIENQLRHAVATLFKSYCKWPHHRLTRHQHASANKLLEFLAERPQCAIETLYQIINNEICDAALNTAIDKQGHYWRMLHFAKDRLSQFREICGVRARA
jgi:hypothetical protein